jgi:hypothetical protein
MGNLPRTALWDVPPVKSPSLKDWERQTRLQPFYIIQPAPLPQALTSAGTTLSGKVPVPA